MRPILAASLAVLIVSAPGARAGGTATLTGSVCPSSDGSAAAAAVWAGTASAPVAADGTFLLDRLPAGPTRLAVETADGLYVVATPVPLAPGTTRRVRLAFGGRQDSSAPASGTSKPPKTRTRRGWANPVTATLVVVGSAIVVGVAVDQLTKSSRAAASPSAPSH